MVKFNRTISSVVLIFQLVVLCLGCGSAEDEASSPEHLSFKVVDSLLAPAVEIGKTGKQFNPPLGFKATSDSMLAVLKEQMASQIGMKGGIELVGCFIDPRHSAAVLVSAIDGLALDLDTVMVFTDYRESLDEIYGQSQIREGEYRVSQVYVKNFLITDSINVRFQLLCLSAEGDGAELIYYSPRIHYPQLVRRFESSIGSLKLINRGG